MPRLERKRRTATVAEDEQQSSPWHVKGVGGVLARFRLGRFVRVAEWDDSDRARGVESGAWPGYLSVNSPVWRA